MDDNFIFKDGEKYFYGGLINDIQGNITIDSMDKILDLIDEYIELVESIK